ncbi:hypothetical protein LDENG_00289890 [Lucifuga dentata]|nr:hypothetical protein LDENG_00289890 [Lucifuga dentata]
MEASIKVFTIVVQSIKEVHKALIDEIEARHNAKQKRFKELIKVLRKEISELEEKYAELGQLSHNKGAFSFLKDSRGIKLTLACISYNIYK